MFQKVLVANRGEIACRIIRTLRKMEIASVAVYSEADIDAPHVTMADESFCLGPAAVAESYLNVERIMEVVRETGAEAIHPGYGLLSENAAFADRCEADGIAFIGPTAEQMRQFGLKHTARALAEENEVPLLKGTPLLKDAAEALLNAEEIGYPVMMKSTAGGGGIGMRICKTPEELESSFDSVVRSSSANFGDGGVFIEKYIARARHIEVQIFGDGEGEVVALGERDCSTQRRNQKIIEETPAAGIPESVRSDLSAAAIRLGASLNYRSAGTVEFLYDAIENAFYFLEVNTRLQVEHGVTELVTGIDLVEWMVSLASEVTPSFDRISSDVSSEVEAPPVGFPPNGHSIQVRLYAEDPGKEFQPSSGLLTQVILPEASCRCDAWVATGTEVTPFYDPLLAKIMVHGVDREDALVKLRKALGETRIDGIETNLDYLRQILSDPIFTQAGEMTTRALGDFVYRPTTIDVLKSGTQTTVQDYPGRIGYWDVGIPPSGPMDSYAFRLGNRILGNPESAAGLEITVSGPTLRFNVATEIALTGRDARVTLDGEPVPFWTRQTVPAGATLKIGACRGNGSRTYLMIGGGLDIPDYLGSKSTFTLGLFGGHGGRPLMIGDVLRLGSETIEAPTRCEVPETLIPVYETRWDISVIYGPHGAPDFFTREDIDAFFSTDWEVHYNSARTGVRLIGPKPEWARDDGGEAGLHPSNIHDNAYAVGTIDFTGDMPVILGPDGPSLGGFVCPATIIGADLWKIGQLAPGDKIRFSPVSNDAALALREAYDQSINSLAKVPAPEVSRAEIPDHSGILHELPDVIIRQSGEDYLLIEYGPMVLDLDLRFKVHVVYNWIREQALPSIIDLTPGIRSLQIHYDSRQTTQQSMIDLVVEAEASLGDLESVEVPARIVHLPLSWDDSSTKEAIQRYMQSVNPDAPWCPSNIEFIRRINGLDSIEAVKKIVFDASYLVMGLGDVYLGAPVATPLDPRHRLVTTKYNPARTWTPENAVGIGGAYLCVYGMEGPGGYQFVGRTVQMWNRYHSTASFEKGTPWLLRFFDQIRWYEVGHDELLTMRQEFLTGRFNPKVETTTFSLRDYNTFLDENAGEISEFREMQRSAFQEERERWEAAGQLFSAIEPDTVAAGEAVAVAIPDGSEGIEAVVAGSLWKCLIEPGQSVAEGDDVFILEAMKMEISIEAPISGTIQSVNASEGQPVSPGQLLAVIQPS